MRTINILTEGTMYDVALYLDERGTPGTDRVFITGGALAYGALDKLASDWQDFAKQHGLLGRKGTDFSLADYLSAAEFLIQHPIMPVAVWSELTQRELNKLHDYSEKYRKSSSRSKRTKRIPPAHWIWKSQMSQTIAYAQVSFLQSIGRIRSAKAYMDEFSDQPRMRSHYKDLLERDSSRTHLGKMADALGMPTMLANLFKQASPRSWSVYLNADHHLLNLADAICAMYGRFRSGEYHEPWEVIRTRHQRQGKPMLSCIGGDVTSTIRRWLEDLYTTEPKL
jgi:hypothetical protein